MGMGQQCERQSGIRRWRSPLLAGAARGTYYLGHCWCGNRLSIWYQNRRHALGVGTEFYWLSRPRQCRLPLLAGAGGDTSYLVENLRRQGTCCCCKNRRHAVGVGQKLRLWPARSWGCCQSLLAGPNWYAYDVDKCFSWISMYDRYQNRRHALVVGEQ